MSVVVEWPFSENGAERIFTLLKSKLSRLLLFEICFSVMCGSKWAVVLMLLLMFVYEAQDSLMFSVLFVYYTIGTQELCLLHFHISRALYFRY